MGQEQFLRELRQICDPPADYLNKRGRHIMLQKKGWFTGLCAVHDNKRRR